MLDWFVVVLAFVIATVVLACTFAIVIVIVIVNIFTYPVTIFDNSLGAASPIA